MTADRSTRREPLVPAALAGGRGRGRVRLAAPARRVVLRKTLKEFIPRTLLQPFLLVFVFTYVFPKIGQGVGGTRAARAGSRRSSSRASSRSRSCSRGSSRSSLPMVQEFGYTREIEDRVLAPLPIALVAIAEGGVGRAQRAVLRAARVPDRRHRAGDAGATSTINWLVLLTLTPLACYMCGALGLTFGTRFEPRTVPLLFGIIVIPLTFLGAIYYPWPSLEPIRWLQILVLANPLVYMCEGFRAALTTGRRT